MNDALIKIIEWVKDMIYKIFEYALSDLWRDIYKMFVWEARPNKKYVNPYLGFTIGFIGMIYFATVGRRIPSVLMVMVSLTSLIYGDYVKGGWKGYKRRMEAKK